MLLLKQDRWWLAPLVTMLTSLIHRQIQQSTAWFVRWSCRPHRRQEPLGVTNCFCDVRRTAVAEAELLLMMAMARLNWRQPHHFFHQGPKILMTSGTCFAVCQYQLATWIEQPIATSSCKTVMSSKVLQKPYKTVIQKNPHKSSSKLLTYAS